MVAFDPDLAPRIVKPDNEHHDPFRIAIQLMLTPANNPHPIAGEGRRFAIRVSIFYGTVLGLGGTYLPFFPVWLKAIGIESGWIGLITAVPSLTRFTVLPVMTRLAERAGKLRETIVVAACLTLLGFAALAPFREPLLLFLIFVLTSSVWTPLSSLIDGYTLKGVARYALDYGPIRLWGSVAFVAGVLICGGLLQWIDGRHVIWVLVVLAAINAVASFGLRPLDDVPHPANVPVTDPALLRNLLFIGSIVAAGLIQSSHGAYYSFSAIIWQGEGYGGATIAGLWSLGVLAEIVVFALSPRFTISPATQVMIGGAIAVLRWVITAYSPPLAVLVPVQLLHGLTFGITHLGMVGLVLQLAPGHVIATAQGYLVASTGALTAVAMIVVGALYPSIGSGIYLVMAALALAGMALVIAMRGRLS